MISRSCWQGGRQQLVGHVHEQAEVAGGVFAEGLDQCGAQELGIAGGFEQVIEAFLQLLGRQGFQTQADCGCGWRWATDRVLPAGGQALIASQDDRQDGARVQVGTGQHAQLGQDQRVHFLGFIDDEHGPIDEPPRCGRAIFHAGFWSCASGCWARRLTPNRWPSSR